MYELAFTVGFRDGLDHMPAHVVESLTRFISQLRSNPFQNLPQAKKLKNFHDRFRARIGGDFRVIYRIERTVKRVVLLTIASRQHVYRHEPPGATILGGPEAADIEKRLAGETKAGARTDFPTKPAPSTPSSRPFEEQIVVEHVSEWITYDELTLLKIESRYHEAILEVDDVRNLNRDLTPQDVIDRVFDYVTNPASSHIGKLYSAHDAKDIARLPLKSFMLALDKEQQKVIERPLDSGPLLVKGGPGTGKSLIGLYRIKHMVERRAAEGGGLFPPSASPRFGVLTFTNTLADLNEVLTEEISGKLESGEVVCSTLDKITYKLAMLELGRKPNVKDDNQIAHLLTQTVLPRLTSDELEVVNRLGIDYAVNEIERVVFGFGFDDVDAYLSFKRTGRRVGLNERYRRVIWKLYEAILNLHADESIESWGLFRQLALKQLVKNTGFPRFTALFVDEVQDLSRTSRRIILNLALDPRYLMMTADPAQSIYELESTWAETDSGLDLRGKVFVLRRNYRTTRENYQAIRHLRLDYDDGAGETGQPMPVYSGEKPVWICATAEEQLSATVDCIRKLANIHDLGQIAVVVRDHAQVTTYSKFLNSEGIEARAVTRNSKLDIRSPHVHIITAHSSKGLEFPAVIVPDVSDETFPSRRNVSGALDDEQIAEVVGLEQRLLYVALSRACHSLVMIENADCPSRFLRLLQPEHWRESL